MRTETEAVVGSRKLDVRPTVLQPASPIRGEIRGVSPQTGVAPGFNVGDSAQRRAIVHGQGRRSWISVESQVNGCRGRRRHAQLQGLTPASNNLLLPTAYGPICGKSTRH
jgi:hypothetical protein